MKRTAMSLTWLTLTFICVISAHPHDSQAREIDFNDIKSPKFLENATWADYPFLVALADDYGNYFGGGVIISDEFVLTSQYNVIGKNASDVTVMNQRGGIKVTAIFTANNSAIHTIGYLAVLQVSEKFDFSEPNVASIELPNASVPPDTSCVVVGVGKNLQYYTPHDDIIHYKNITTIDKQECIQFYDVAYNADDLHVPEDDLCGQCGTDYDGLYLSDPGNPLLCDGQLFGIASWACLCELKSWPAVFADVFHQKAWIELQMNGGSTTADSTGTTDETQETTTHGLASINSFSFVLIFITLMFTISEM